MDNLDAIDTMLQTTFPTVMVPTNSPLPRLGVYGHRFLAASNGLWIEVRRHWLHAILPIALQDKVTMPYGGVSEEATIVSIPYEMIEAFKQYATSQLPNECAAHIIQNTRTGVMRLQILNAVSAGHGHVNVLIDPLEPDEVMVLDIHSHGFHNVYFSKTDDIDDKAGVKLAAVIGFDKLSGTADMAYRCKAVFRLCVLGHYTNLQPRLVDTQYQFSI